MADHDLFEKHGLFSARVPRYTSYPPANRFQEEVGLRRQDEWLSNVTDPLSIYIHIPFCKRLCWFCACRTQGTSSMRPVEAYVDRVLAEIKIAVSKLPPNPKMSRLHLGGGTPTILNAATMDRLLTQVFELFSTTKTFEFSVEVDPTDASEDVLNCLIAHNLHRASIGVQDFDPRVQKAIGREQSVEETYRVVKYLRENGVSSTNFDLLYGLPFQTRARLEKTIDQVLELKPNRLALYGYAHVPWMSKRQVMIDGDVLPGPKMRLDMAEVAGNKFCAAGYEAVGIDHFALPEDGLAKAKADHRLVRNFQGYSDDSATTILGFGASAISRFPQGFVQNAVSTSAYNERISRGTLAGFKGYALTDEDKVIGWMVEQLMCYGAINLANAPESHLVSELTAALRRQFADVLSFNDSMILLPKQNMPLARLIASALDEYQPIETKHSLAI